MGNAKGGKVTYLVAGLAWIVFYTVVRGVCHNYTAIKEQDQAIADLRKEIASRKGKQNEQA